MKDPHLSTLEPNVSTFRTFQVPKFHDIEPEIFVKRKDLPAAVFAAEADTLGWDTVNSIRMPVVNQTLAKSSLYPKTFTEELGGLVTINGDFTAWQMVRGGSGAILFLRAPISAGHMTYDNKNLNFTDGYVTIAIKLNYLPQPPAGANAYKPGTNGKPQYLVSDFKARGVDDPAVVIQTMNYGTAQPDAIEDALFKGALSSWFNKNLNTFTYIFTTVNINALAAKEAFQWLKPTYTSYAYYNGPTDEESFFGVLNMTENDSAEGLSNQLPPSSVPAGCNAALLISNKKFLSSMVLPGLSTAFPKATESNFGLANNNTVIEKKGDDIELEPIRVNGLNYTPYMQEFTYQVVGDEIQINTKVKIPISAGIDAFIRATAYYKIKLVPKPDGKLTLDFEESKTAKKDSWSEIATWVTVTVAIIAVITACIGAGIASLTKQVFLQVVAGVITAIIVGIIAAIPTLISEVVKGRAAEVLPPIGDLVTDATGDIKWPDSKGFTPTKAEMNGSLQIGGNLES